jgi:hypothetical protein
MIELLWGTAALPSAKLLPVAVGGNQTYWSWDFGNATYSGFCNGVID